VAERGGSKSAPVELRDRAHRPGAGVSGEFAELHIGSALLVRAGAGKPAGFLGLAHAHAARPWD